MRVAVLGSGPSLCYFDKSNYDYAIGANDIYTRSSGVDAVCCTDNLAKIKHTRPDTLQTPINIPIFLIDELKHTAWKSIEKDRRIYYRKTRRWNGQYDVDPSQFRMHGYHTPFFCASVAIEKGATSLHFFGIDGGNFTPRNHATIIDELNYLHRYIPVYLSKHSELWERQLHPKCVKTPYRAKTGTPMRLKVNEI